MALARGAHLVAGVRPAAGRAPQAWQRRHADVPCRHGFCLLERDAKSPKRLSAHGSRARLSRARARAKPGWRARPRSWKAALRRLWTERGAMAIPDYGNFAAVGPAGRAAAERHTLGRRGCAHAGRFNSRARRYAPLLDPSGHGVRHFYTPAAHSGMPTPTATPPPPTNPEQTKKPVPASGAPTSRRGRRTGLDLACIALGIGLPLVQPDVVPRAVHQRGVRRLGEMEKAAKCGRPALEQQLDTPGNL